MRSYRSLAAPKCFVIRGLSRGVQARVSDQAGDVLVVLDDGPPNQVESRVAVTAHPSTAGRGYGPT